MPPLIGSGGGLGGGRGQPVEGASYERKLSLFSTKDLEEHLCLAGPKELDQILQVGAGAEKALAPVEDRWTSFRPAGTTSKLLSSEHNTLLGPYQQKWC